MRASRRPGFTVAGAVFAPLLLLWTPADSAAQRGAAKVPSRRQEANPGGAAVRSDLWWLLDSPQVHKELKATEEQVSRLKELVGLIREQFQPPPGGDGRGASARRGDPQASRGPGQQVRELQERLLGVLQPAQLERLRQLELQQQLKQSAPMALTQPDVSGPLALDERQRQELARLADALQRQRGEISGKLRGLSRDELGRKMADLRTSMEQRAAESNQKAMQLLSAQQKEKLKQVLGEPLEVDRFGARRPAAAMKRPSSPGPSPVSKPAESPARPRDAAARSPSALGVGFLIGEKTKDLVGLLTGDKDFLEMVPGPDKVRHIRALAPPAKAMCVVGSLEALRRAVELLQKNGIDPSRVYLAYNPEPRAPGAHQWTPREEVDDFLGSLKKAREALKDYPAELIMGPGMVQMGNREHLYPELAKWCDIWMIQSQKLQIDLETNEKLSPAEYRRRVQQVVDKLREGNPKIRVFVQIIPLSRRVREPFTAEEVANDLMAIDDLVEAAKIYGGDTELIREVIQRLRAPREAPRPARAESPQRPAEPSRVQGPGKREAAAPRGKAGPAEEKTAGPRPTETVHIDSGDGARLATDIYLPPDYGPEKYPQGVPVIMNRTPYGKDRVNEAVARWRAFALRNGYAFVNQDMRGHYGSAQQGVPAPAANDGYQSIEWLAKQPWCSGKIGMMGFSHLGAAQYEAAVTRPPHLACAIPAQAPGNYYTDALFPPRFRKADMETILRGPFTARTAALLNTRIRRRDEPRIGQFQTPMLHSAGWYDFYKEGAVEMFRALQEQGGPGARGQQKLLIGPWGHGVLQEEQLGQPLLLPGGLAYPPNAKLDWENDVWLPWFDHWLKGRVRGATNAPAVRYYLMGDVDDARAPGNRWIEADSFPPPSAATKYFLRGQGLLSPEASTAADESLEYRYDPRDPAPWVGRFHASLPVKGPFDQREAERRADVLVFTTPALTEALPIVGAVRARLWAASDRKDTDFTVRLTDVYPDGRSMFFLDGIVKGRYRNTYLKEEPLEPGRVYEFEIDLGYIALVLAPRHRLRVAVSSSCFDRWDINPNTGEPYGDHAVSRALAAERLRAEPARGEPQHSATLVATNRVYLDKGRPSHVELPVVSLKELVGKGD